LICKSIQRKAKPLTDCLVNKYFLLRAQSDKKSKKTKRKIMNEELSTCVFHCALFFVGMEKCCEKSEFQISEQLYALVFTCQRWQTGKFLISESI